MLSSFEVIVCYGFRRELTRIASIMHYSRKIAGVVDYFQKNGENPPLAPYYRMFLISTLLAFKDISAIAGGSSANRLRVLEEVISKGLL